MHANGEDHGKTLPTFFGLGSHTSADESLTTEMTKQSGMGNSNRSINENCLL